jgi:cytochrome c peroxidase
MKKNSKALQATTILIGIFFVIGTVLPGSAAMAQIAPPPGLFQLPLNQITVPEPPGLFQFVKNKPAAIKLGKAFFWDMQVGSDGVQACASCHFHAGADNRLKNTVNPGMRGALPDTTFQVRGPNETLDVDGVGLDNDFPFHLRQNPDFQSSPILRDSNDVVGSQGVLFTQFVSVNTGSAIDSGTPVADPVFNAGGFNMRRVTARNTPSNINAVFNFHNFWDGRAHFIFNGVNPFGPLDTNAGVWFNEGAAPGTLVKRPVAIDEASLASQATGPPLDDTEMSFTGRTFPELGRKMLSLTPLGKQMVHPNDSVLGPLSKAVNLPNGKLSGLPGLNATYEQMIRDAFVSNLWNNTTQTVTVTTVNGPLQFKQIEANFSLFWGLAIQLYEATLVSDQTPFDRFLGGDQTALTAQQVNGMNLFFGAAKCDVCHGGTELTSASVTAAAFITLVDNGLIDQMPVASGLNAIYDTGFNDTAVRPITDDIGRGGNSPIPNVLTGLLTPLSYCAQSELQAAGNLPFPGLVLPGQIPPDMPVTNDGAFKVPGLRNIELTAPYFHDGSVMTLEDVVDFYTRGGNFPQANINHLDFNMTENGALQNQPTKMAELVAFMMSLTDERVRNHSAPFDHPELFIPNGDNPGPEGLTRIAARNAIGSAAPAFVLTIDPLPAVTNKTSLLVSGTKEGGATVAVKVNNGSAMPATATGSTTWSATIGLAGGENTVTAIATDVDGNAVSLTANLSVVFADGRFGGAGPVGITDALKALHIAVGLVTPTADDLIHGDVAPLVNGVPAPDGRIGADDALLVLKKVAGLVNF